MNSGSKKTCIEKRDRLSELPDEVLVHILSFLPTFDAVRTVLLRRFGNLWTLVPTLRFHDDHWENYAHLEDETSLFSRFLLFVHNVLIFHKKPTFDNFILDMGLENCTDENEAVTDMGIKVWMGFVLSRQVKVLSLEADSEGYFDLPACVFSSQSLVIIKLRQWRINFPSRVHMGSLRTLVLKDVRVESGDLNEFLSGCPSLQELVLHNVDGKSYRVLNFSTPSIEKLEVYDEYYPNSSWTFSCPNIKILNLCASFGSVKVLNVQSVRELNVSGLRFEKSGDKIGHRFKRFLEAFQSVEVLTLATTFPLESIHLFNLGFPQNRWKRVVLKSWINDNNIASICSLVRDSPCLEELIIHVPNFNQMHFGEDINVDFQEASFPCVAPRLKLVSMHGYEKPYDTQLRLIEFLLKSAVTLDKLVIFSNQGKQLTSAEERKFVKQLLNFSRTSTKARIVLQD